MDAAVSVRNVTKTYVEGGVTVSAVQGVTLDIRRGEVALLMGPSGSGKTTLVSMMGCILRATSGTIEVCGRDATHLSERELPNIRLRHIGFVFQGFNLFPTLTAGENVEMTLDLKGVRGRAAKVEASALLERVGLLHKYRSFPADLSGGQKQRVAIARALAGNPDVILADEPTAALDSHSGATVMEMLCELARERGRAVAIVTHDNRILKYADRIIRIEDGRIAETAREERSEAP
jgi:putative ABC transport system ATP-binding protein